MNELEIYLNQYFGITNEDLQKVAELFTNSAIRKNEYFVRQGQYCDRLSFVRSGYFRIFSEYHGKEVTQWVSSKGYFLTELSSFLFDQRSRFNIQAITDCEIFSISKEDYKSLAINFPNWANIEKQFIGACFITLENRVFQLLSMKAEERYKKLYEENKDLFINVPQMYLASMLGMSPETFSRIRANFLS